MDLWMEMETVLLIGLYLQDVYVRLSQIEMFYFGDHPESKTLYAIFSEILPKGLKEIV